MPSCRTDRRRDTSSGDQMVVLDQDTVIQARPVVLTTSGPDRILFKGPQPRGRLSRVHHDRVSPGNRRHVPLRQGRDTAQSLDKVQGNPFGGKDRSRSAVDGQQYVTR